jgi:hypothetical protein
MENKEEKPKDIFGIFLYKRSHLDGFFLKKKEPWEERGDGDKKRKR